MKRSLFSLFLVTSSFVFAQECPEWQDQTPLTVDRVITYTLCHNPTTAAAWANLQVYDRQVGIADAADLPTVSLSSSGSWGQTALTSPIQTTHSSDVSAVVGYTLYDFGGRDAKKSQARALVDVARAQYGSALQSVMLDVMTQYYDLVTAMATLKATLLSQYVSYESYQATQARYEAGKSVPAEVLQAKTAYEKSHLAVIQAQTSVAKSEGLLKIAMGLDPWRPLQEPVYTVEPLTPPLQATIEKLLTTFHEHHPQYQAMVATLESTKKGYDATKAATLPTVSLSATSSYGDTSAYDALWSSSVGVKISVPLFTGFADSYRLQAGQWQIKQQEAELAKIDRTLRSNLFSSYQTLKSSSQELIAAQTLLDSATRSWEQASGRYKAGVGSLLDLLNAQQAFSDAQQSYVAAQTQILKSKVNFMYASGDLSRDEIVKDRR